MASSQTLYSITITNGNSNSAPKDGFVDNLKIENYNVSLVTTPVSLTLALAKAKRRANIRYREIINQLAIVANTYVVDNAITSDATYHSEATSFTFLIIIEHGDACLTTPDESNPGQFLTGTACITRCVARALTNDMIRQEDFLDPTDTTSTAGTTSVIRYGTRIWPAVAGTGSFEFEIGNYAADLPTAEGFITTTKVVF